MFVNNCKIDNLIFKIWHFSVTERSINEDVPFGQTVDPNDHMGNNL